MRVLGVDWGERRLGIAVSDETQTVASPHAVERCRSDKERIEAIQRHAKDLSVNTVVLGMPLSLSGEEGPTGRAVRRFSELLGRRTKGLEIQPNVPKSNEGARPGQSPGEGLRLGSQPAKKSCARRGLTAATNQTKALRDISKNYTPS